jgi:hypothetical protein
MKLFVLFTFLIMSFSSFANDWHTNDAADPRICGNNSSCTKGIFSFVGVGEYFARGVSRISCNDAVERANETFLRAFGNIDDCGLFSGPSLKDWSCTRRNGRITAWVTCNPNSGPNGSSQNQRRSCVLGGVWICGR